MRLRRFTLLLCVSLVLFVATGCSAAPAETPAEGEAAEPAILRIGWPGSPDTLNPAAALVRPRRMSYLS